MILSSFQGYLLIIAGASDIVIYVKMLIIFSTMVWTIFFGPFYMTEQYRKRIYENKGQLLPRPRFLKTLRDYLRGGEEYYAQDTKEDAIKLQLQMSKRALLLLSPAVLGTIILMS
jgi:hypothetical protein